MVVDCHLARAVEERLFLRLSTILSSEHQHIVFHSPDKQVAAGYSRVSVPYGIAALCVLLLIDETWR